MKNTKCLVVTHGFFGDITFASSIAERLKYENKFDQIDYLIGFPQMKSLLENNPHIYNVFVSRTPTPLPDLSSIDLVYDKIITLPALSFLETPTIEYQKFAGVKNPKSEYRLYTNGTYDLYAKETLDTQFRNVNDKKIIAVLKTWEEKSYLFTQEEYDKGIDVPNLGYGGKHRNINYIVDKLNELYNIIYVGFPMQVSQHDSAIVEDDYMESIIYTASILKNCDAFVGTEGGLCNIAAGVGTKTIITGDFVHQLYGANGVIRKIKEPKLGPKYYFPDSNHVTLNPFLTDDEVFNEIVNNL